MLPLMAWCVPAKRVAFLLRWMFVGAVGATSSEGQRKGNFSIRLWRWLFGKRRVGDYFLGQCCRCRTMFWEDGLPLPSWREAGMAALTAFVEM